ncbi:DUF86 domain-containing protein [Virgibacillus byunsanensis]|uniref:DUF86 domain-containing protein n=1 Tax=Virgibacillus byunsanensis TaxID=570945 RepID=A0ABW3LNR9_9BACI
MYFIDRSKIEKTLEYMDGLIQELNQHSFETSLGKLGLERITHMTIESMLDIGNMMIDGFIMRDPGSYEDIIDILVDELVLPNSDENKYKEVIRLRKLLVKDYLSVDHSNLITVMIANKPILESFSTHVRTYLDNELGVANAFSKE